MQENTFPAAEKILSDIENVIKKDTNLQSFEIILEDDNENKSPVYHEENSLGLASWCIQPLYCYTYNRLIESRNNKFRREDPGTTSRWLLGAILLNPDVNTFWNMRRELVRNGRVDAIQELRLIKIVLFHKAKCFEAFSYRRWIIQYILTENRHLDDIGLLLQTEINVAVMSADRYANNYHAWSYRQHVVSMYEALVSTNFHQFIISEWESSENWCSLHVSDHSGLSYRQFLLKKLLIKSQILESDDTLTSEFVNKRRKIIYEYVKKYNNAQDCKDISCLNNGGYCEILNALHGDCKSKKADIDYERVLIALSYWVEDCILNQDLIKCFPGHEALWYHRRFLGHALRCIKLSYSKYSCYKAEFLESPHCIRVDNNDQRSSDKDSHNLLEIAFTNNNIDIIEFSKHQGSYQSHIADKFIKFLDTLQFK
ncbi:protein prenyltransferase alpha subunit repeat-containing protein 1-A isoform X1 [Microplitis demolitor]|uniref:protein prenyltransferase alpha subunit repeat-containing protein 1-A isoform X1 n=1 Tax=Microplitis demolitor TaxID=69319 RepID=UPI0004CCE871|nr:protein prenyltransferase alpha subunit repeat-containing protein 1-A isoform X1 [Microplitis demolitor]